MLADLLPEHLIEAIDDVNVMDDQMYLVPAGVALRTLCFRDLWERNAGLRPAAYAPHPLAAQLEFTQRCNLTCDFCYNDSGPKNRDELDLRDLARVCRELVDLNILELIISGGEPLLRPKQLGAILEMFSGTGIPIHLLTNGTLLTDEKLAWLRHYNVVTLQVSLDGGDPRVHDRVRGREGAWAKTVDGLSRAHEHGFYTIVSCTLNRDNASSIGDLVDYCYLLGVNLINVGDLITWGRAHDWMNHGACTNEQFDDVAEILQLKQREFAGHLVVRLAVSMLYYICKIRVRGQESILIRGNGDVIPHCTLSGLVVGNVKQASLREIWDRSLKSVSEDERILQVLADHEVVRTERFGLMRCLRRIVS